MTEFGIQTAPYLVVKTALVILSTLPESGKMALIGLGLISGALFLRKLVVRFHATVGASAKADAQAK